MTSETEVSPYQMLSQFSSFPHSEPILKTFRTFVNHDSLRGSINPDKLTTYFFVEGKPKHQHAKDISMKLDGDPVGPAVNLILSLPNISINLRTGYESPSPYVSKQLKSGIFVYPCAFYSDVLIQGRFVPSLPESKWFLKVISSFGTELEEYFHRLGSRPEPRIVDEETLLNYPVIEQNFLASLTTPN